MKHSILIAQFLLVLALVAIPLTGCDHQETVVQGKPYPLNTCLVCDMKFGDSEKPYSFVYQGQEIKVCDKGEKADFDKDPAKFMKKLADAEAKPKQ